MMFDQEAINKMPIVFKTLIGFILFSTGVYQIAFSGTWANGDLRFYYVFIALGVMFCVNGVPALIDGVMTMFANQKVE